MLIEAIVTKIQKQLGNATTIALGLTPGHGSLRIAQTEGEGDEATRAGIRFRFSAAAATGIAPVQALPTTAAQWLLWNPANNPSTIFIDEIGVALISGTGGANGALWAAIVMAALAPATVSTASVAGVKVKNSSPGSTNGSGLVIVSGATLQNATAADWFPLAEEAIANTVLGQTMLMNRDVRGKIAIAPGSGLALVVISPTGTTPLFAPVGTHREYATVLE